MSREPIPLFRPTFYPEEVEAVAAVLRSGWRGRGLVTEAFEADFATYLGGESHCVATCSCTAALECAIEMLTRPGDAVAVPAYTFAADAHAVLLRGRRPVFVDVDIDTGCLSVDSLREVTARQPVQAVIVVHYAGYPSGVSEIRSLLPGVAIIEDCAHAVGASWAGHKTGTLGHAACFSFHAVKALSCGDGGMVVFRSADCAARARGWVWHGIDKGTAERSRQAYQPGYEITAIGIKGHMNDLTAAIGRVQLAHVEQANDVRRQVAAWYSEEFGDIDALPLCLPAEPPNGCVHAYHLYPIMVQSCDRDRVRATLAADGVTTGIHYRPLSSMDIYGHHRAFCPQAEALYRGAISLPMGPHVSRDDVRRICAVVRRAVS